MCYLVLCLWNKAGLAQGYGTLVAGIMGLIITTTHMLDRKAWKKDVLVLFTPLYILVLFAFLASNNPVTKIISKNDLVGLNLEETILNSKNPNKINFFLNSINSITQENEPDATSRIAKFYYYKNSFKDKYKLDNNDTFINFYNNLEDKFLLEFNNLLPRSIIGGYQYVYEIYFLFINLSIGIFVYLNVKNRTEVKTCLTIIVLNAICLVLVGFYQKYDQQWSPEYKEILGIWDAPEPRYYFSTFTYKNHWCAFAILSLFSTLSLMYLKYRDYPFNILHSKFFIILIIIFIAIYSSILFSGSRSGILIASIALFIFLVLIFRNNFTFNFNNIKKILYFNIIFIPLLFFVLTHLTRDQKIKEMVVTTKNQFNEFKRGKAPLRWLLWQDTSKMIQQSKWYGHGYNSFSAIYPKFQSLEVRQQRAIGLENAHQPYVPLVAHAHSDFLEFLSEWGLLGAFLIFLPYCLHLLKVFLFSFSNASRLMLAGCITFLIYCLIDFPSRTPACLVMFTVVAGLGVGYSKISSSIN